MSSVGRGNSDVDSLSVVIVVAGPTVQTTQVSRQKHRVKSSNLMALLQSRKTIRNESKNVARIKNVKQLFTSVMMTAP